MLGNLCSSIFLEDFLTDSTEYKTLQAILNFRNRGSMYEFEDDAGLETRDFRRICSDLEAMA